MLWARLPEAPTGENSETSFWPRSPAFSRPCPAPRSSACRSAATVWSSPSSLIVRSISLLDWSASLPGPGMGEPVPAQARARNHAAHGQAGGRARLAARTGAVFDADKAVVALAQRLGQRAVFLALAAIVHAVGPQAGVAHLRIEGLK